MRILHIIDSMGLGGAQTVVKGIFEKQNQNSDIFLYALRKRDINIEIDHPNIFANSSTNKYSFPIFKLTKFIKKHKINVLHCHLAKSQIMGGVLKTFFFPKIKLVFHEHGEIFQSGKIYPFLMNLFRKKVNTYIAVSKATKKYILQKTNFENTKIQVLYNFVDLDKFKKIENYNIEKERKKYGLDIKDFVIGFASRLYEGKGWKEFLNSAKKLTEIGYNLKFIIGGDGVDKEKIKKFISQNRLKDNIKTVGYVSNMVGFYNMIDCFVFPSHREALPMTILEVNGIGIPLIASNIDGVNEIMINNKNALLFEKQSIDDLVSKIKKIYKNEKLRNELIQNGFEEVKKYSLEKYLFELNKIYE